MSEPAILCYGELGIDNLIQVPYLPTPEKAAFPSAESYHIGGAAANTAVWLAHWDVPVSLTGNVIGTDPYGRLLMEHLQGYPHMELTYLRQEPDAATPFCRVLVTPDGERTFLIFGYPQSKVVRLTEPMLKGVRYLALDLYGGEERLEAARLAREHGVQVAVGDLIWPEHEALALADIVTNSAAFIRESCPGVEVLEHARQLWEGMQGLMITTDGAGPIHVIDHEAQEFTLAPPAVEPVDATGAGDAFRAGLLYGLLQGWSLARCVGWGAAAGALGTQMVGAASNPAGVGEVKRLASGLRAVGR